MPSKNLKLDAIAPPTIPPPIATPDPIAVTEAGPSTVRAPPTKCATEIIETLATKNETDFNNELDSEAYEEYSTAFKGAEAHETNGFHPPGTVIKPEETTLESGDCFKAWTACTCKALPTDLIGTYNSINSRETLKKENT